MTFHTYIMFPYFTLVGSSPRGPPQLPKAPIHTLHPMFF